MIPAPAIDMGALAPTLALLVAAAARGEEVDARHPLNELVAGLDALDRLERIDLGRLSEEETALLAARAGRTLDEDDAGRLFAETEGNPLFVVEALRAGWTAGEPGHGSMPRHDSVGPIWFPSAVWL